MAGAAKSRGLSRGWRKSILFVHVLASVGWFGITAVISVLEIAALRMSDVAEVRAAYGFHELLVGTIVIPSALTTIVTGVTLSVGTPWGLIKYYWPPAKLMLTIVTIAVTVAYSPDWVSYAIANAGSPSPAMASVQQGLVALAGLHLVALAAATWLSIFKPFGRIRLPRVASGASEGRLAKKESSRAGAS